MFSSLWKIQKIRKIRKKSVFPRFRRISGIFGISRNFGQLLPKNDMFRQKPEDKSKSIYLAPQNRKQNVEIQSRTLWKSFQLECTIYTIILGPDIEDDVIKNVLTSAKNIFCNYVPYITYHIRGKFYYHSSSQ